MDNNELYHYGVPGMRWGQRKSVDQVSGGNTRTTVNKRNNKTSSKKYQSVNNRPQAKKQQKKQQKQEPNEATEKQTSSFKKGMIAAGVALAIIGTFLIVRKIGQKSMQTPAVEKKVSKGKKAVNKMKNKKVTKKITAQTPKQAATKIANDIKKQNPKASVNYNAVKNAGKFKPRKLY